MGPNDLLCAGLSSCLNITARMILDRKKIAYEKVLVKVDLQKLEEGKSRFVYDMDIVGELDEEVQERVRVVVGKSPVVKILTGAIEVKRAEFS